MRSAQLPDITDKFASCPCKITSLCQFTRAKNLFVEHWQCRVSFLIKLISVCVCMCFCWIWQPALFKIFKNVICMAAWNVSSVTWQYHQVCFYNNPWPPCVPVWRGFEVCVFKWVVVAFSSLARIFGEGFTIYSPTALLLVRLKWRLPGAH